MRNIWVLAAAWALTLLCLSFASAAPPRIAYVDAKNGSNANTATNCALLTPCADLNTALSVLTPGASGIVAIVGGGAFGPVVITSQIFIIGTDLNELANIFADPTAQVGCVGHLPPACALTNNSHALEFTGGPNDDLELTHVALRAVGNVSGAALRFNAGRGMKAINSRFNGNDNVPTVQIYPNNNGGPVANIYFADNMVSGGTTANAGAVEVKPSGNTSVALHFNHVQVQDASFGIRSDGSLITSGNSVTTAISESQFFGLLNAAVNAFSFAGTGRVNATFDSTRILSAAVALKANGPLTTVVLTNNTVTGNGIGVQTINGATVLTSGNNTIRNNTTNISGTPLTAAPFN